MARNILMSCLLLQADNSVSVMSCLGFDSKSWKVHSILMTFDSRRSSRSGNISASTRYKSSFLLSAMTVFNANVDRV